MKSIKYLLISLLTLSIPCHTRACWGSWYAPGEYYMYRVYDRNASLDNGSSNLDLKSQNCVEWQKLTSHTIPLSDIYQVVYDMTLEEYEVMHNNPEQDYENKFAQWITKHDRSILDFLLLAKTNEYIRFRINSRWYYPSMKIGARMTLDEVAEQALAVTDKRLRNRYLLQAVRALFTLGRYKECIEIWENEVLGLPDGNLMKRHIRDYIAGALHHVGSPTSVEYFAEIGDVQSVLYCSGKEDVFLYPVEALALVCQYAPNSNYIPKALYEMVHQIEMKLESNYYTHFYYSYEEYELYDLCLAMGQNPKTENQAMWYYTAAYLSTLIDEVHQASKLLDKAEVARSTPFIDESIAVLRMYVDAKRLPYNAAYENKLYKQLQWLDKMIVNNITDEVRTEVASGYKLYSFESFYYWNDMLRRILLAEVCPRMIQAGKSVRALQLANMADNYIYDVVGYKTESFREKDKDGNDTIVIKDITIDEYRYSKDDSNFIDYSNHFFETIDSLGVDIAIAYLDNVEHSTQSFDKYLNARGYTNRDYLYDIVGTQCLRQMRYGEAVKYLGRVSTQYVNHSNIYICYEPFAAAPKETDYIEEFKYDFAREMYSLEQSIQLTTEPNRKAQMMLKFALGLRNSFNWCWGLTQYYRGSCYWGAVCDKRDWENDHYTQAAIARANKMVDDVCKMTTDDEVAASIHYELCNFKTIARQYSNTKIGQLVRGSCDNLDDYHAMSYVSKPLRRYY